MDPNQKTRQRPRIYNAPEGQVPAVASPADVTSVTRAQMSHERERDDERRRMAIFMIFGALLLAVLAYSFGEKRGRESRTEDLSSISRERSLTDVIGKNGRPKTFDERVRDHRDTTGLKLNRDRIRVQYDNLGLPVPDGVRQPVPKDSVMRGLPMDVKKNEYSSIVPGDSRPTRRLEDDSYGRIQLARDLDQWEAEARAEYIRQFKANARAHGYEVYIDKNYNVEWEPMGDSRSPQSEVGGR